MPAKKTIVNKIREHQQLLEEHGRVPPQAPELEESVLGAILIDPAALGDVIDILKPDVFYKEAHYYIFQAITELYQSSNSIDVLTVVQQLRKNGKLEAAGGAAYIAQLTRKVLSSANVEYHSRIILQKFIQRELIRISSETIKMAYDDTIDVFDLLNNAEEKLFSISEGHLRQGTVELPKLLNQARENIDIARKNTTGLTGIPSGFIQLDRITGGWQKSDLIIIAARPAMGKTAFVLSLARNAAVIDKIPVAIFSLEMSNIQLATRLLAAESMVQSDKIRKGQLDSDEISRINEAMRILSDAPIYIDDTPALSVFELRAKCRRFRQRNNVQLIIIDYLQLMTNTTDNNATREQEISSISRAIKALAKELNVPILCLSQLSRGVEKRTHFKPQLSDLRESGSIEQDADIVLFLYRPEYYKLEPENGIPGSTEIIIAKHRNGPIGSVFLKFEEQYTLFRDLETHEHFADTGVYANTQSYTQHTTTIPSRLNSMTDNDESDPF